MNGLWCCLWFTARLLHISCTSTALLISCTVRQGISVGCRRNIYCHMNVDLAHMQQPSAADDMLATYCLLACPASCHHRVSAGCYAVLDIDILLHTQALTSHLSKLRSKMSHQERENGGKAEDILVSLCQLFMQTITISFLPVVIMPIMMQWLDHTWPVFIS